MSACHHLEVKRIDKKVNKCVFIHLFKRERGGRRRR